MESVECGRQTVGMKKLPVYITTSEVAVILEWTQERARDWLISSGAAVKRGTRWVTTPELLRRAFPEVWDEYLAAIAEREEDD